MTHYPEETMMKLYGFGPTRSLRALWGLKELGAEFEFIPVNLQAGEHQRPEFLALNPAGKVPVLVDGDFVLTESAADRKSTRLNSSHGYISYAVSCLK